MIVPDIIIAVDGFSGTGKSTLAKLIAEEFSFLYLDSGALYRGVTLFAQENGYIEGTRCRPFWGNRMEQNIGNAFIE